MAKTILASKTDLELAYASDWTSKDVSGVQTASEYLCELELTAGNEFHYRTGSGSAEGVIKAAGDASNVKVNLQVLIPLDTNAFEYKVTRNEPFKLSLIGHEA